MRKILFLILLLVPSVCWGEIARISPAVDSSWMATWGYASTGGATFTGNITMPDDGWIGISADSGRIELESNSGHDLVKIHRARLIINDKGVEPTSDSGVLHISSTSAHQFRIENAPGAWVDFECDPTGDLQIRTAGGDVKFSDENLWTAGYTILGSVVAQPDSQLTVYGGIHASGGGLLVDEDLTVTGDAYHVSPSESDSAYVSRKEMRSRDQVKSFTIKSIADTDDFTLWKTPTAITIDSVFGKCTEGTNVVGALDEYDWDDDALVAVVNADWTITTTYQAIGSFTNAGIAAKNHLRWHTTSVSGTVTFFQFTIWYHDD